MPSVPEHEDHGLFAQLDRLWQRKGLIVITIVVVGAVALGLSLRQHTAYEAHADVLLKPSTSDALFTTGGTGASDPVRSMQTEMQLVQSETVQDAVRRELDVADAPPVTVTPIGQSNVLRIAARDGDAEQAAAIANSYASSYIAFRRDMATRDRAAAEQAFSAQSDEVGQQIDALNAIIDAAPLDQQATVIERLAPQRDALITQQADLTTRLREVKVQAALEDGDAQIVSRAAPPHRRVAPTPVLTTAIGLALGAILGVCLALLFARAAERRSLLSAEWTAAHDEDPASGHGDGGPRAEQDEVVAADGASANDLSSRRPNGSRSEEAPVVGRGWTPTGSRGEAGGATGEVVDAP